MSPANFRYALTVKKIWRDLWQDPTRSFVVVITIAISVFLLGTIYITWLILPTTLAQNYAAINPAHGVLFTTQPFDAGVVTQIRRLPGVADVEARTFELVSIPQTNGDAKLLHLFAIDNFEQIQLDKIVPDFGTWPPPKNSLLLERSTNEWLLGFTQPETALNKQLILQFSDMQEEQLIISGQTYDFSRYPSRLADNGYAYISQETLRTLGGRSGFNMLLFRVVGDAPSQETIAATATQIQDKLEEQGIFLTRKALREPNVHPLNSLIESFLLILAALGILGLVLSAILILNTITTLQASQVRQVGIMKTIGALPANLISISLSVVFGLGITAVIIAFPLSIVGGYLLTTFGASLLNLELTTFQIPAHLILIELTIGLLFPLLIALIPILKGSSVTVREAISDAPQAQFGVGQIDRLFNRLRSLPIFVRYGLRNIFRHKLRTALVIVMLSVAGAIFMTTISLRASLLNSMNDITSYWQQDIQILLAEPTRPIRVERVLSSIPEVVAHEGRLGVDAFLRNKAEEENKRIVSVLGLSPQSSFIHPTLLEGRWLTAADQQAIVLNVNALNDSAGIALNEWITLEVNGRSSSWQVVGISSSQMIGNSDFMSSVAYVPYASLAQTMGHTNRVSRIILSTSANSSGALTTLSQQIEERLEQAGVRVARTHSYTAIERSLGNLFAVPVSLTVVMTILFSIVGGLGLMGMMGLNVMQRTREIGVIRTIGSTDLLVARIIITEGLVMGLISWGVGLLLALPLSRLLGSAVGQTFINADLTFAFPLLGIVGSLGFMLAVALLACYIPARNASQLIIRNALSYE